MDYEKQKRRKSLRFTIHANQRFKHMTYMILIPTSNVSSPVLAFNNSSYRLDENLLRFIVEIRRLGTSIRSILFSNPKGIPISLFFVKSFCVTSKALTGFNWVWLVVGKTFISLFLDFDRDLRKRKLRLPCLVCFWLIEHCPFWVSLCCETFSEDNPNSSFNVGCGGGGGGGGGRLSLDNLFSPFF